MLGDIVALFVSSKKERGKSSSQKQTSGQHEDNALQPSNTVQIRSVKFHKKVWRQLRDQKFHRSYESKKTPVVRGASLYGGD